MGAYAGESVTRWRLTRVMSAAIVLAALAGCAPSATDSLAVPTPTPSPTDPPPVLPPPPAPSPSPTESDASECSIAGGGASGAHRVSTSPQVERPQVVPARSGADPWEGRPVVRLCFDVPADRQTIQGLETVIFTPDLRTCEIVFRAWPNKPETARAGNALEIDNAVVDGAEVEPEVEAAGAPEGAAGTLIRLPVDGCVEEGQEVEIVVEFTLTLGPNTPERIGYIPEDGTAWFATAYPLLAWERGRGWATEPAVDLFGEMTTSETYQLASLEVVAPDEDDVLGIGQSQGTRPGRQDGTTVHRFTADAVRDVAVTVGRLETVEREVSGVRITVGAPRSGTAYPLDDWLDENARFIVRLMTYFGDFPYEDLWISILPSIPSGIEFPGAIQYGDVDVADHPDLVPHELAHMWFYGLVGNNQARDPWLDEAFAVYAEQLVNGTFAQSLSYQPPAPVRDRVGESMNWYAGLGTPDLYSAGVYRHGAAMLHEARQLVGAGEWDRLLRGYLDTNAHRIATPSDVGTMLSDEPVALAILTEYGALPD